MRHRICGLAISGAIAAYSLMAMAAAAACPPLPEPEARPHQTAFYADPKHLRRVPPPARHFAVPAGAPETIRIVMGRTYCTDNCPIYTVEIQGDGAGVYRGDRWVLVKGEHPFRVPPETVQCLVEAFRASDFWSLAPSYSTHTAYEAVVAIRLEIGGQAKTVEEEHGLLVGMPEAVARLEAAIDAAGTGRYAYGDGRTVAALRAEGFDFRSRAAAKMLIWAADASSDEVVLDLIAAGAPVNQAVIDSDTLAGNTAAETAAHRGRLGVVKALVAAGAFVRAPYRSQEAALVAAAKGAHPEVAAELLKGLPDVNARDARGRLALLEAASDINPEDDEAKWIARKLAVVRLLLTAGADARLSDDAGKTALHRASSPEEVRLLLAAGAMLEARNEQGETPLLATVDDDVALALVEAGADVNAKDSSGETIAKHDLPKTLSWLRAHGQSR
jgi:ankyrin repeat protein